MLTNVTHSLATQLPYGGGLLPLTKNPNVPIAVSDRTQRLKRLNMVLPGIYWDKAYPDTQPDSCAFPQFNILELASRVAARLSHYSPPDTGDNAFHRYFVTDGRVV
jgi:hypothetical protein